ncbi:MAG: carbonic anhydrase [Aggregatilineales bacterium]
MHHTSEEILTADQALERLLIGNRRYIAMRQLHPRQSVVHRQHLVQGQHPFAAILSCSDSRVPSELIFDQGLGDLFIVRTAGHAVDDLVLASLEYAVFALQVPLVMVLGHTACGAVTSVMEAHALPGHLPKLAASLKPALAPIDAEAKDALEQAIRVNSLYTAAFLAKNSLIFQEAIAKGRVKIVAAYYALSTGEVQLLE